MPLALPVPRTAKLVFFEQRIVMVYNYDVQPASMHGLANVLLCTVPVLRNVREQQVSWCKVRMRRRSHAFTGPLHKLARPLPTTMNVLVATPNRYMGVLNPGCIVE